MHQNEMKRTFYMDFHMDFQECVWCNEITNWGQNLKNLHRKQTLEISNAFLLFGELEGQELVAIRVVCGSYVWASHQKVIREVTKLQMTQKHVGKSRLEEIQVHVIN